MPRYFFIITIFLTALSACGGSPASSPSEAVSPASTGSQLEAFATTSMLADIAQRVAGERVRIESILPIGADPHSYQYTPQDVTKVADAKLLIPFDILLAAGQPESCGEARALATRKIAELDAKIRTMQAMQRSLEELVRTCDRPPSGRKCPLLESIQEAANE